MIDNYLSKRRLKNLESNPIIEKDFDVCNISMIDEYVKAIEFVLKYNKAFGLRLRGYDFPNNEIQEIVNEISLKQYFARKHLCGEHHPIFKQIENRKKLLIKHLLFKHKQIPIIND